MDTILLPTATLNAATMTVRRKGRTLIISGTDSATGREVEVRIVTGASALATTGIRVLSAVCDNVTGSWPV